MSEFNVTCYVDEDAINKKIQNAITRYAKELAKDAIEEIIREEVQKTISNVDLKSIVIRTYKEQAREDVEQMLYRLRRDDYERFHWNGKEVDPSPEKMFKLMTAYISYVDLMDDPEFKKRVLDVASYQIYNDITTKFGKNHGYKKLLDTLKTELEVAAND